ncbi:LEA14-like dessication related protein [Fodinibius roseus]|uniref:LEA14-like dessication related protein n=1 Tax=Fodinibius roseus TaxID=1194090 RepID=A0A1M4TCQ1_9BACT|nr:LEA type 2 family protein [Fodinibius roseus]SHE42138.1 LEA14-like dessication related protein [Fodinibius roseus]
MKIKTYISLLLLSLLLIGGCRTLQDFANSIREPRLSVENVRVTGFNFQQMELTYDIKVENPNSVAVRMLGYDYNLDLNDNAFISGNQSQKTEIEASGESIFQVPMTLNFSDVYRTVSELSDQDETSYHFLSHLRFDLPVLGATEIPVRKQGSIPLLKRPKLDVQNLEIKNLSLSGADVVLKLAFNNPNGFGLDINQLTYDLQVNGDQWADGTALQDVTIRENGITELDIPISLNISKIGMSAYRILSGSEPLDYQLKGHFKVNALHELLGSTNLHLNRSGKIPVGR